jgi:hypothetical protein
MVLEEVRYTCPVTSNPGQESRHYGALHRFLDIVHAEGDTFNKVIVAQ